MDAKETDASVSITEVLVLKGHTVPADISCFIIMARGLFYYIEMGRRKNCQK